MDSSSGSGNNNPSQSSPGTSGGSVGKKFKKRHERNVKKFFLPTPDSRQTVTWADGNLTGRTFKTASRYDTRKRKFWIHIFDSLGLGMVFLCILL